jgi:hypothetical protein
MLINGLFTAGQQAKVEFPAAGDYWVCGQWNMLAFDKLFPSNYAAWSGGDGLGVGYIIEAKGASSLSSRYAMPLPLPCPDGGGDCLASISFVDNAEFAFLRQRRNLDHPRYPQTRNGQQQDSGGLARHAHGQVPRRKYHHCGVQQDVSLARHAAGQGQEL